MRHAAAIRLIPAATRGTRRWRRMRARIGLLALWAALLVWALGASVRVPGEVGAPPVAVIGAAAPVAHVDLERAAAWPRESADAWQAPSQEPVMDVASEPDPEQEAALYIAGR